MTITLNGVAAGRFRARRAKRDGRRLLLIFDAEKHPIGIIAMVPADRARRDPGRTTFTARDGSWFIPNPVGVPARAGAVLDQAGHQVGQLDLVSRTERELALPGGPVRWSRHMMRPQYRVAGLFVANRTPFHSFMSGLARVMFTGEVTPALAARPDAALALLIPAWLTWRAINDKVADEAMRNNNIST